MKKLLIFLVVLGLSACFCGCGSKGQSNSANNSEIQESVDTIFFSEQNVSVEIYESVKLSVQNAEGKTLTWRSANPEKLTVDEKGVVFAKMAGTIAVYVSDGTTEVSCTVTILNNGYIPLLKIDLPDVVRMIKGDTYMLAPYITYNGVRYDNATFTYTATGSVSVAANGEITANSVGTGVVTVTASWNGIERETLNMEIEVVVIE